MKPLKRCYICNIDLTHPIEGKLYDGRIVNYCSNCWESIQDGLKVRRLRQLLELEASGKKPRDKSHLKRKNKVNPHKTQPDINAPRHTFTCLDCNTTWKYCNLPLEEVQAEHVVGNKNHRVILADKEDTI